MRLEKKINEYPIMEAAMVLFFIGTIFILLVVGVSHFYPETMQQINTSILQ